MKPRNRKKAVGPGDVIDPATMERMAGAVAPAELSQSERRSLLDRIMERISVAPPPRTYTVRANEGTWISVGPGVELKVLRMDREANSQTVLFRMQPGSQIVPHPHNQEEECLVMEGEILVGEHRVGKGDMHIAMPGAKHPPILAPHGALLCIRSEIPPQHFRIA